MQELENGAEKYLLPEETAVIHLPELVLTDRQAWRITQGVATSMAEAADGFYRLKGRSGEFFGIGKAFGGIVKGIKYCITQKNHRNLFEVVHGNNYISGC